MVPAPPDLDATPPLIHHWPQGAPIVRVFNPAYPPNSFNPGQPGSGVRGRFHFFPDAAGTTVPVLYGADRDEGAISETIFHDAPVKGRLRTVQESRLAHVSITTLRPERDLRLVELFGFGLRRLEITAQELTDTPPTAYRRTVPWAEAFHRALPDADGLVWMSKQFNAAKALILFGDRVQRAELSVVRVPLPLLVGPGRDLIDHAANQAGITLI